MDFPYADMRLHTIFLGGYVGRGVRGWCTLWTLVEIARGCNGAGLQLDVLSTSMLLTRYGELAAGRIARAWATLL